MTTEPKKAKGKVRRPAASQPAISDKTNAKQPASPRRGRPPREELTPQQLRGIDALMTEPNMTRAAEHVGVSPRTMSRWIREPKFRAEYLAQMREMQLEVWQGILNVRAEAWDRFLALMNDGDSRTSLRAATWVLGRLLTVPPMIARLDDDEASSRAVPPRLVTFLEEADERGTEEELG